MNATDRLIQDLLKKEMKTILLTREEIQILKDILEEIKETKQIKDIKDKLGE